MKKPFLLAIATLAFVFAFALAVPCPAEDAAKPALPAAVPVAGPVVVAEFSNPGLSPSHWVLTLHPDGSAHFRSQTGSASPGDSSGEIQLRIPDVNRDVHLSPKFAASVFTVAQHHSWFNEQCESHVKVAFQGLKTLSYIGPEGKGSCTFNYSRDKDIQNLGDTFIAVSQTIVEGVRLEMLLQHDPLGLEQEIESLSAAAQDGRAQQICAIRNILERLAQDDNVMEMVRKRARLLLARAES